MAAIKKNFKGKEQKELLDILSTSIELINITKIYRFKKYFKESNETIKNSLYLEHCRMSSSMLDTLIEARSAKELMELLANSKYKLYLQKVEVDNLKHIIEGIRYGRDASSIEEMLIFA